MRLSVLDWLACSGAQDRFCGTGSVHHSAASAIACCTRSLRTAPSPGMMVTFRNAGHIMLHGISAGLSANSVIRLRPKGLIVATPASIVAAQLWLLRHAVTNAAQTWEGRQGGCIHAIQHSASTAHLQDIKGSWLPCLQWQSTQIPAPVHRQAANSATTMTSAPSHSKGQVQKHTLCTCVIS